MKATELRIGNLVDYYTDIVTIDCISEEEVSFVNYITIDYPLLDEIKPIPLTEERLVRFGFQWESVSQSYWNGKWHITKDNRGYKFKIGTVYILIKYIHQLQNLYFALTGEELKYD